MTDTLINEDGVAVKLDPPSGEELPARGFAVEDAGYQAPIEDGESVVVKVDPNSDRLQLLQPFVPISNAEVQNMRLLIKAKGKCTTDHISMAGPWLTYRGHLENISNNLLIGAINAYNEEANKVWNAVTNEYHAVPDSARTYQKMALAPSSLARKTTVKALRENTPLWSPASWV